VQTSGGSSDAGHENANSVKKITADAGACSSRGLEYESYSTFG